MDNHFASNIPSRNPKPVRWLLTNQDRVISGCLFGVLSTEEDTTTSIHTTGALIAESMPFYGWPDTNALFIYPIDAACLHEESVLFRLLAGRGATVLVTWQTPPTSSQQQQVLRRLSHFSIKSCIPIDQCLTSSLYSEVEPDYLLISNVIDYAKSAFPPTISQKIYVARADASPQAEDACRRLNAAWLGTEEVSAILSHGLATDQQGLIRSLSLVYANADNREVGESIKHNLPLYVKLLRIVNTPHYSEKVAVSPVISISGVVSLLGRDTIAYLCQLGLESVCDGSEEVRSARNRVLMIAKMAELVASTHLQGVVDPEHAFCAAVVKELPEMLNLSMEKILLGITLPNVIVSAVAEQKGFLAQLLESVRHYIDFSELLPIFTTNITDHTMFQAMQSATEWTLRNKAEIA